MQWSELYGGGHEPPEHQIREYVATPLWEELADHLRRTCNAEPKSFYSGCSMDNGAWKGWNVRYKKGGRTLCTLYPKSGYFIALINIGAKESAEADLLLPLCDAYTQALYSRTKTGASGKSLAVEVTSEAVLRDVKNLIALRAASRTA